MAICGVEPRPLEVLPYMGHSQTVNDWTVRVFDEIRTDYRHSKAAVHGECLLLNSYVREAWIGEQVKFHASKCQREKRARSLLAKAGDIVLPTTIAAVALHLLLLVLAKGVPEESIEWAHKGLAFIALSFPAIATPLAGMEAHRAQLHL